MSEVYREYLRGLGDSNKVNRQFINIPHGTNGERIITYDNQGTDITTARLLRDDDHNCYENILYSIIEKRRGQMQSELRGARSMVDLGSGCGRAIIEAMLYGMDLGDKDKTFIGVDKNYGTGEAVDPERPGLQLTNSLEAIPPDSIDMFWSVYGACFYDNYKQLKQTLFNITRAAKIGAILRTEANIYYSEVTPNLTDHWLRQLGWNVERMSAAGRHSLRYCQKLGETGIAAADLED